MESIDTTTKPKRTYKRKAGGTSVPSVEAKPIEIIKPVEVVEVKPVEVKSVEVKPVEVVEVKPVEVVAETSTETKTKKKKRNINPDAMTYLKAF
jgi:ribosomal protein L3